MPGLKGSRRPLNSRNGANGALIGAPQLHWRPHLSARSMAHARHQPAADRRDSQGDPVGRVCSHDNRAAPPHGCRDKPQTGTCHCHEGEARWPLPWHHLIADVGRDGISSAVRLTPLALARGLPALAPGAVSVAAFVATQAPVLQVPRQDAGGARAGEETNRWEQPVRVAIVLATSLFVAACVGDNLHCRICSVERLRQQ